MTFVDETCLPQIGILLNSLPVVCLINLCFDLKYTKQFVPSTEMGF